MFCIECGAENGEGLSFCTSCGAPLDKGGPGPGTAPAAVRCPACGAANEAGGAYCIACGAELGGGRQRPGGAGRARRAAVAVSLSLLAAAVCASAGLLALHRAGALPEAVEEHIPRSVRDLLDEEASQYAQNEPLISLIDSGLSNINNAVNRANNTISEELLSELKPKPTIKEEAVSEDRKDQQAPSDSSQNDVQAAPETTTPDPVPASQASTFPRQWEGYYIGTTDGESVSRSVKFLLYDVGDDGSLRGECHVSIDDNTADSTYYIEGNVNWDTGDIEMYGISWLYQGELYAMRNYWGIVSSAQSSMSGTTLNVEGEHRGEWRVMAV